MARADASTGKITLDRTRPLIENKRVIDRLVFESISKEDAVVPCLQITGPSAILYSVRLVRSKWFICWNRRRKMPSIEKMELTSQISDTQLIYSRRLESALGLTSVNNQENNESTSHKDTIAERRPTWIPPANNSNKIPPLP